MDYIKYISGLITEDIDFKAGLFNEAVSREMLDAIDLNTEPEVLADMVEEAGGSIEDANIIFNKFCKLIRDLLSNEFEIFYRIYERAGQLVNNPQDDDMFAGDPIWNDIHNHLLFIDDVFRFFFLSPENSRYYINRNLLLTNNFHSNPSKSINGMIILLDVVIRHIKDNHLANIGQSIPSFGNMITGLSEKIPYIMKKLIGFRDHVLPRITS